MRVLVAAGILLALGAMAILVLFDRDDRAGLPGTFGPGSVSGPVAAPGAPLAAERSEVPQPAPPPEPHQDDPQQPNPATENDPEPDEDRGSFIARIFDGVTHEPLQRFRYVLDFADGRRTAELVEGHELRLRLPREARGQIVIEADGYEPSTPRALAGAEPVPPWPWRIELVPAMAHSGVEYHVQAPDGTPVPQLEVEAWRLGESGTLPRSLWRRRATNAQGRYELPDLKPGRYRIRLRAAPGADGPSTYRVHEHEFDFTGTERIIENVCLEPGAILVITANDVTGRPLGREVEIRVVHPDGQVRPSRWVAEVGGEAIERTGGLPAAAPSRTVDPLAPGTYTIELRGPAGVGVREIVDLVAGQVRTLRVTVP